MTPSELLPCPFCGDTDTYVVSDAQHAYCACPACGMSGPSELTQEAAIQEWNTRAQAPRQPRRLVLGEEECP